MEPLGTITKYYPFIDEESKSILDSLMDESNSYYDFVQQLCDVVIANEVPVNLGYITAVQAWWCRIEEKKKQIQEKFKDVPWIQPWGYYLGSMERDQIRDHDAVVAIIDKVIESQVSAWIEVELHFLHAFYHWPIGETPSLLEPIEKARRLVGVSQNLTCFESLIHAFEAMAMAREGSLKEAILAVQRGQELAEVHDDSLYKYMNLLELGTFLRGVNIQDSLAQFEELYDFVQDLEVPYFVCEVLNDSSITYETAGEFDLAISCHLEILKSMENLYPSDTLWILLSRNYATLGDGHQALEWINRGFESCGHLESPTMYHYKAWALALLDRIDEAERTLDIAHPLIIKSGLETQLGTYYHISGVIELRKGDFLAALDLLEKAWNIAERNLRVTDQNRTLLDLARAEILIDNQSIDSSKVVIPGKWLSYLEKFSVERDLPGIRMYAALLKAEFYQNHDQLKDATALLVDALDITDSLGVKTLRKRISARIQELDGLMPDEEMVS